MSINAAMLLAGVLLLLGIDSSKFSARIGVPVLVLFLSMEIDALRQVNGEILDYSVKARTHVAGQRLRDLSQPELPLDLALSFHAAITVEQLLGFYGLPLPTEWARATAAQSLNALLASTASRVGLRIGALLNKTVADCEHVTVNGGG